MPAATEATLLMPGLSPVDSKPIGARFDGGALSSDGDLLVLPEVEQRPNVVRRLAACIHDSVDRLEYIAR
ncbi:transposase [Roseomonas sp. HJA6]|uniref:Transposase n=1 Tax=Roseomonas alba TaxID=2846776 RepID=A0ABS7AHS8_9PROT|nr:transposase [Neoroseomonas alba]